MPFSPRDFPSFPCALPAAFAGVSSFLVCSSEMIPLNLRAWASGLCYKKWKQLRARSSTFLPNFPSVGQWSCRPWLSWHTGHWTFSQHNVPCVPWWNIRRVCGATVLSLGQKPIRSCSSGWTLPWTGVTWPFEADPG